MNDELKKYLADILKDEVDMTLVWEIVVKHLPILMVEIRTLLTT